MATNGQLVFTDVDKVTFKGVGNTSNAVIDTTTGKIGVGVDSPDANLHVVGNCFVSTNFELGGTMSMGTVTVRAQHELSAITATGNTTPHTVEFQNATTGFVTTANIEVGTANLFVDTSTSNVGIGTNAPIDTLHINGGTRFAGHIIPTTNATFDIGSAENKVRDLYVDTNSIWVGDRAKIAFENGKMKFKRRKLNKVPRMLVNLAISGGRTDETDVETHAITFAQTIDPTISTVSDLKLQHLRDYAKTFDDTKAVSDIFADNEEDYEAITASEAFMEVGSNIFTEHSLSIGKTTDPTATLDIYKEDTTAAGASTLSSITGVFSGSDATGGTINNRGLYINLDSSATGGTSSSNPAEEHRVWGIDVDIDVTGDSDDIRGGRFLVRSELAENGTDRTSVIYGIDAQGQHNGSAPNTNITGVNARSFKGSNSTGSTTKMVGVNAEYEINAGTCTDAYGVRSLFDRNGGAVTNSYLFYGGHVGDTTTITNNYGLYVTGTDKHYLEGDVGIGTSSPVYNLDVNNEIQIRGQGLIYHANETSDSESSRYFLHFNKTLDASYPVLCNRTPNGNVVIATGTSSGGGEVERMRFNGGDGTITMDVGRGDVYFENNSNDNASGNGITLRTPTNPGSTGSIFAVRSSGNGCRLWVGQDVTAVASDSDFCAGQNGYAVGSEDDRSTYNFIVKAGGNVGIGTTSPGARLHVYDGTGTVASEMILGPSAAADTAGIVKYFHGDGSGTGYMIMGNWGDSMSAGTGLVVKKGGDVGIGTTSPVGVNGGQRIEGSSSGGFEYIATRSQSAVGDGSFIGAYLFKNNDAGGTEPHYAGMSAKATGTGGNMVLYFHTARENYETDTSDMILDSSGRLEVGGGRLLVGTGGKLGLTINDGDGNANITFNHADRVPDQNGSAGRIDCGVDGNAGYMRLRVKNSVTAGTTVNMPECLRIEEGYVRAYADLYVDDRVGIGTTSPYAKLHVVGNSGSISSGTHYGFKYNTAVQSYTGVHNGISIYADDDIVAGNWVLSHAGTMGSSDERIKKEIVDVEDGEALSIIRLLKPKRYKYRDDVKRGIEPVWGFIAQEVADTIPYATQKRTECIPNIYETVSVSASNVITFTNFNTINLESNATSRLKLYDTENNEHMVKLVSILGEHIIQVEEDLTEWLGSFDESNTDGNDIFVYGEEVNDFHFLNKNAIWTVATAALQEVDRQLQVEKARNDALEARILALENA